MPAHIGAGARILGPDAKMEQPDVRTDQILDGIERYPEALQFMFSGGNTGKLLVKIS